MAQHVEELKSQALHELQGIDSLRELETWRIRYLGKKSELTGILRGLAALPLEEKKTMGARANQTRIELETAWKQKEQLLREKQLAAPIEEVVDITLPGRPFPIGHLHP